MRWLLLCVLLAGCAGGGRSRGTTADLAAEHALAQIGRPYRFGGADPKGFDCSGLVRYSYGLAGRDLPHGTASLLKLAKKIKPSQLRRGDLVFFNQEGKKSSHVGLYVGDGEFVHAPSSGKRVRRDRLDERYWRENLSSARRL